VLDRDQNFYPNPGPHFFRSQVKVSLPASFSCLATGQLISRRKLGDRDEFIFASPGGKGVSLVCGGFTKLLTIPGKLPVQVFGNPKLKLKESYSAGAIKEYVDFLWERFGPLEIPELNLLLSRGDDYGGWSHQGFVVFNLMETVVLDSDASVVRRLRSDSPLVFEDINRDNLVHELAHQWWGGVVSWQSYQDQWLTEGLAQFATLLYLQNNLSDRRFRRIVAGAKRWIFRHSDSGPIIYGKRIGNLSEDLQTFQSIVYNKAALVFLMLREMLGEEEVLQRLRQFLADCKNQNVASGRFIQHFSQGDRRLQKFFNGWIHSRKLPRVHSQVTLNGSNAEVALKQENTDFVFPVSVRVVTAEGKYVRTLIVEAKEQKFKIAENVPILSVDVEAGIAPIELKR
jgi:aminopeptidase N